MLSARALAAHLTSEDHPSKKICPHLTTERSTVRHKPHGDPKPASSQGRQSSNGSPSQPKIVCTGSSLKPSTDSVSVSSEVGLSSEHVKRPKVKVDGRQDNEDEQEPKTAHKKTRRSSKGKDQKSLTQNLCDAASMILLQFATVPQPGLALISQGNGYSGRTHRAHSKRHKAAKTINTSNIKTAQAIEKAESSSEGPEQMNRPSSECPNKMHATEGILPTSSRLSFETPSGRDPTQAEFHTLQSNCEICTLETDRGDPLLFWVPRSLIDQRCLSLKPGTRLKSMDLLFNESHAFPTGKLDMEKYRAACKIGDHGTYAHKRELMRQLSRSGVPSPVLHCSKEHKHAQNHPSYAQSLTSILGSSDNLLRSFIRHELRVDASMVVWSNDFSDMVDVFQLLHQWDYHPVTVFSSLWQSSHSLYVSNPGRSKGISTGEQVPNQALEASSAGGMPFPSHTGGAHITKIIFAALVASIQRGSSDAWLAAQKLRRSGHIMLPPTPETTPELRGTITTMDAFEDDMAHMLLKRLTRAIATMVHVPHPSALHMSPDEGGIGSTVDVVTLIVRGLIDPEAVAIIHKSPGDRPTLKGGVVLGSSEGWSAAHRNADEHRMWYLEAVVEWLRGILLKEWDGKAEVPKCSAVGGALELLACLCKHRHSGCDYSD